MCIRDRAGMGTYVRVALPECLGVLLEELGFDLLMVFAAMMEDSTPIVAAMSIGISLYGFPYFIMAGVSEACTARIGNALGRDDIPSARRSAQCSFLLVLPAVLVFVGLYALAGSVIVKLYTSDSGASSHAVVALRWIAVATCCDVPFVLLTLGVLTGLGDTTTTALCRLLTLCVVGPTAYWLGIVRGGGIAGLWQGSVSYTHLTLPTKRIV
eukprot:TRINITY_DN31585_c0_g1_i2.p2 TRINITY_DN31585_c0_g1~~TRINITY_DN31585_c0_g1_i2.p2  ORF type:complete len:212 (+),score=51.94 TRINITY_DN31585_c0_g1_i2:182-817(+)